MNCNGYCSQCEQNKSCHLSTRIKKHKTPFREWFERQSYKENNNERYCNGIMGNNNEQATL